VSHPQLSRIRAVWSLCPHLVFDTPRLGQPVDGYKSNKENMIIIYKIPGKANSLTDLYRWLPAEIQE
jgi:hypothetical protein